MKKKLISVAVLLNLATVAFADNTVAIPTPVLNSPAAQVMPQAMIPANASGSPKAPANAPNTEGGLIPPNSPYAQAIIINSQHPISYVVQPGDTLWAIAGEFLQDPLQWRELWPNQHPPTQLYPGDILTLKTVNGKPQLFVSRGGTVKLKPGVRTAQINDPVPVIPLNMVKPYLLDIQIMDPRELKCLPRVSGVEDEHVVGGAGDSVYVRRLPNGGDPRMLYHIYRKTQTFNKPQSGNVLGVAMMEVGQGKVTQIGNPASMLLTSTNREIQAGDYIVLTPRPPIPKNFHPRVPNVLVKAQILSVLDGVSEIGQYDVVVLSQGAKNGVRVGDILTLYQGSNVINSRTATGGATKSVLPPKPEGTLMVFQTSPELSFGLVLEAIRPIHVLDTATNPNAVVAGPGYRSPYG